MFLWVKERLLVQWNLCADLIHFLVWTVLVLYLSGIYLFNDVLNNCSMVVCIQVVLFETDRDQGIVGYCNVFSLR